MIKLYSFGGVVTKQFIEENKIYNRFQEVDAIDIQAGGGAAGPNESLQIILDVIEVSALLGISEFLRALGKEFVKVIAKDFFDKIKSFGSPKNKAATLIDKIEQTVADASKTEGQKPTIVLGMERISEGQISYGVGLNIGFNITGMSIEEIQKRLLVLAIYGEDIRQFLREVATKHRIGMHLNGADMSGKISLNEDGYPFIEYNYSDTINDTNVSTGAMSIFRNNKLKIT